MPELIVALDVPTLKEATALCDALRPEVAWFKVGLELFTAAGPAALDAVRGRGGRVMLDLKLHDIPETVARAAAAAGRRGAELLTLHAAGGETMLRRAAAVAARPRLLAVTVLTSHAAQPEEVRALALAALGAGCDGVVCAVREAALLRDRPGLRVTPGIRPAGAALDDHARGATPAEAAAAGATHVVVGRPIRDAADPLAAARAILAELRGRAPG